MVEVFEKGSEPFQEALQKIPQQLLDLFESQFRVAPSALLAGGIVPDKIDVEVSSDIEDDSTIEMIEEEDSEQL